VSLPLWQTSVQSGEPDQLLGYPVVPNNDVATMAANAKSILFGDFRKYKIRRVRGGSLVRLNERYADALQVGFFLFGRVDGNLIDAGTNPIKYYANSAT
jgi:HK97 family phage major capsid protein